MKRIDWLFLSSLFLAVVLNSCSKDHAPSISNYTVPTTYNFANFNDSNVLKLLAMADQIAAKISSANTAGVTVSGQQLKDMFNNVNGYFVDSALKLNSSGLKLASYCSSVAATDLSAYFDSVGLYSQSTVAGSNGVAGRSPSSVNASKKLLLSPGGLWYYQLVRKTLNDITAAAITTMYLTDSVANSTNNTTVIPGSGTAMEHSWDEAFGFFGVPVDFPANKTALRYFGSYSNQVDAGLGSNAGIMNAFLKGRAAITAKDLTTKTAQAAILVTTFEQLTAAAVVQEMKETDANIDAGDAVSAYGTLSESLGFIRGLKYYTNGRKIADAQITQLLQLYDGVHPNAPNLYNFLNVGVNTATQIKAKTDAIRQFIGQVYGFTPTRLAAQ
jgi:hypothetical protein